MNYADSVKFLVAMIVMMNPLGSLSIFLQYTNKTPTRLQKQIATKSFFAIVAIMFISVWLGGEVLDLLGITLASFRFAGGIILFLIGLSMLQIQESAVTHTPEEDAAAKKTTPMESIAVVPLSLPIIMGPGAISTLVIAANDYSSITEKAYLTMYCMGLAIGMGLILFYGPAIARFVGKSMMNVITRIMGMVIMAIAVGMLANGLVGLIPILGISAHSAHHLANLSHMSFA